MTFTEKANQIFKKEIRDYTQKDNVENTSKNKNERESKE